MSELSATHAHGAGVLDRLNPLTPFLASMLFTAPLLTTIDWVSALVGVAFTIVLIVAARVSVGSVLRRTWPILLAAPFSGLGILLYGEPGGTVYWSWWIARISDQSIALALGMSLRVLAIGVPTLVLVAGIDPTRLADSLALILKLPARFVLGALAGFRLFAVFVEDWESLTQARRARGLGDHGKLRGFFTMAFALLVLALRRGGHLATAMEARGFGGGPRTWARTSRLGRRDWIFLAIAFAAGLVCIIAALLMGTYHLVGSGFDQAI